MKIALTSVFLLAVMFALGQASGHASGATDTTKRDVYTVCNESRMVLNGGLEDLCGKLQAETNTEFLCDANNANPDTFCWVETK